MQGSRQSQEASPFAPMAGSTGAGVNMGSGSSRQTQAGVTDSMGSSVDCRCTAGELRTSKSFKEPSKRFESWLVLEYCDCGNLSSYLANWPPPCSSRCESTMLRLLQLLQDTANGLQELHHQQVVHGDLVSSHSRANCSSSYLSSFASQHGCNHHAATNKRQQNGCVCVLIAVPRQVML